MGKADNIVLYIKEQLLKIWRAGAVHIFTGSFLNKFVVFFGSIVIVRLLSKDEYGMLGYVENLYNFAYILAGFGLSNAILRYVVIADSIEEKKSIYNYASGTAFKFNVLVVAILAIVNIFYPHSDGFEKAEIYIYIIILMLPFQYYVDNTLALERAMFSNKRYAILSFVVSASIILGKLIGATINGIVGVLCIGIVVNFILATYMNNTSKKMYFHEVGKCNLTATRKKEINTYAVQYMITNGIWTLFMLIDVFMLGKLSGSATIIADYKVAYSWPANISIICSAIGVFLAPYFVKNENNPKWVRNNFIKAFAITFLFVAITGIVMIILAKPLIFIYGGTEYYNTIPLMRIITLGSIINNGLRYTTANILAAMGKIKYNMVVSVLGIVMQIILNILMIPKYGMYGPAYTSIMTYSAMAVILFVVFAYKYKVFNIGEKNEK